jgi:hypothetical protein
VSRQPFNAVIYSVRAVRASSAIALSSHVSQFGLSFCHWVQKATASVPHFLCESSHNKGKIERFNRTVDSFLDEAALKNCKTPNDYNKYFKVWLAECYQPGHMAS